MPITIGTRLGRYEIRSKIGAGGMGEVYLAQDTKLDRYAASSRYPLDHRGQRCNRKKCEVMFTRIVTSLLVVLCGSVSAVSPPLQAEKSCREHPQLIGKCFNVRGRLSIHNGNPAVRLWRIGTRRVLGVSDQRFSLPGYRNLPEDLSQKLNGENSIIGDFLVCPFTSPKPREMQLVCIESAKNVAVEKRK